MYSNIIGKEVWNKCKDAKIWTSDYFARIELRDNSLCDRIDICYDSLLESGEIKYVNVIWYCENRLLCLSGEENCNLSILPLDEQKAIFDIFEKELPFVK